MLAVTKQIADHGLDLVPVIDRFGKVVIDPKTDEPLMQMRDADLALKANELLGRTRSCGATTSSQRGSRSTSLICPARVTSMKQARRMKAS